MVKQVANKKGAKTGKKSTQKFTIDCKLPIEDNVIVLKDFESFLTQKIKVDNKTGNLGSSVTHLPLSLDSWIARAIAGPETYLARLRPHCPGSSARPPTPPPSCPDVWVVVAPAAQ